MLNCILLFRLGGGVDRGRVLQVEKVNNNLVEEKMKKMCKSCKLLCSKNCTLPCSTMYSELL